MASAGDARTTARRRREDGSNDVPIPIGLMAKRRPIGEDGPVTDATHDRGSWFVPHDIAAPIAGAARGGGPLEGLTVAVKDAFDIAGERTGGGSPEWLA